MYMGIGSLFNIFQQIHYTNHCYITVREEKGNIVFLRKLESGGSNHSFGIHVARMAGMPQTVVLRANELLAELEELHGEKVEIIEKDTPSYQMSLLQFESPELEALTKELKRIEWVEVDRLSDGKKDDKSQASIQ